MALSMSNAIAKVRDVVAEVTGMQRVFAPSETDTDDAIPMALHEFPCAIVMPGPDSGPYILMQGQQRHTYEVKVLVFAAGYDLGERAENVLPFVDLIIAKFVGYVGLGTGSVGLVNSCLYKRQSGFVTLEYAGQEYLGYEITIEISEQAAATPAIGA